MTKYEIIWRVQTLQREIATHKREMSEAEILVESYKEMLQKMHELDNE